MRLASMVRGVQGLLGKLSLRRLTRGMPKTTKMKILTITMLVLLIMVVVPGHGDLDILLVILYMRVKVPSVRSILYSTTR
jgi:hypothetical protein